MAKHTDREALRPLWRAIKKFANDEPLTEAEWGELSTLTMIDKRRKSFEPGNIRWATSAAERAENLAFYRSLGHH
jgi:hypothetical protein